MRDTGDMRASPSTLLAGVTSIAIVAAPRAARADEETAGGDAVGLTIDLLPTVMSAFAGELGGGAQIWYGHRHLKARLVGAHIAFVDAFAGDGFHDKRTDVGALIVDYVTGDHFDGWWVGAGAEYWANSAASDAGGARGDWSNVVATAGGGYIWRVWGNFFVEPWGAGHVLLTGVDETVAGARHEDQRITGEVSLKLGAFVDL